MYRLVETESQIINQKIKCLMYVAVIQCLLGKIVLYESVHMLHINVSSIYPMFYVTAFLTLYLGRFLCLLACRIIPLNI